MARRAEFSQYRRQIRPRHRPLDPLPPPINAPSPERGLPSHGRCLDRHGDDCLGRLSTAPSLLSTGGRYCAQSGTYTYTYSYTYSYTYININANSDSYTYSKPNADANSNALRREMVHQRRGHGRLHILARREKS